jgi:C-terminal processing protease CtpA/Prc
MFMYYQLSVPSFAEEKNAEEYLKENELLAAKNPQSFVKRPYLGADIKIDSVNELVSIDVSKGLPANEAVIKLGDVAMQIGGDSVFSGYA